MPDFVTKDHFDGAITTIRGDIRDAVSHLNESLAQHRAENKQSFAEVDAKLDAIMEILATREEVRNLVRALKKQGIKLEETDIFRV